MAFKAVIICASALLVQTISAQCIGNAVNAGMIGNGLDLASGLAANGLAANGFAANGLAANGLPGYGANGISNGGSFLVTSSSPISPTGLRIFAENLVMDGLVTVGGQLPLLGAVALEGRVPTNGNAGISYGCGNGNVGISSENYGGMAGAGLAGAALPGAGLGYGAGLPGLGMGAGLAGLGGCAGRIH